MPERFQKTNSSENEELTGPTKINLSHDRLSGTFKNSATVERMLRFSSRELLTGSFRIPLYRYMVENIPLLSSCLWTWVRITAAPGRYEVLDENGAHDKQAELRLDAMARNISRTPGGGAMGLSILLPELTGALFRDGIFGGFVTVKSDSSGVDKFLPIDGADISIDHEKSGSGRLYFEADTRKHNLDRPDFYYLPFNSSVSRPLGQSIFQAVPFVAYIEQQLVDDMRRTSHNSGYHRLHVKIVPPDRIGGESDKAYINRINKYFDSTVSMVKSLDVDENPVTWSNVEIEHIGPTSSKSGNNWFFSHRSMIEDICAGTNLAPFLLGYSYGATNTWSAFKFDVVMRQVRSIQAELSAFLEWLGNIDLALGGIHNKCTYRFNNSFTYQALDEISIEKGRVDNLLKLYQAGLIDRQDARAKAEDLI